MLQKFNAADRVLSNNTFISNEVQYNLLHRISESTGSSCLKADDETMIYAQSTGNNAWIWISKNISVTRQDELLQELIDFLKGTTLPGVSGEPTLTERFAQIYSKANSVQYQPTMRLESYFCSELHKPVNVRGTMRKATRENVETVAEFLAGFSEGAYGIVVDPATQIPEAVGIIDTGGLYLWFVDGHPASMANIAHRSPRHARINAVYTPASFRKKGYASALVAELCSIITSESLVPMLYADLNNPDSNKVYQKIGFVESGKIVNIKFK
ncbi:GNAT family N-acetyltransferase [Cohnella abietis]|uniref:N-acetyltransferase n=1 Tax=Cohnella abietis TaxID=2507935 RepID=A0A3T1D7I6_9BACL|nr:GNAT family N-acetyltransferase [Cohnella abietis]BBI34009.1 N-acetyltransferase [Cohnella abietis]